MRGGIAIIVTAVGLGGAIALARARSLAPPAAGDPSGGMTALRPADGARTTTDAPAFPVRIHRPAGPPMLDADDRDELGRPVLVACSTCHSIKDPAPANRATDDLDEFHQDLVVQHGTLTCLSCHNQSDYDTLRLASGETVPYAEVMLLCGQCHGTQLRDYLHGAHGGMAGYWDLTRGPRDRNNCTDCHDAHAPAFPMMLPTFKPIDRFLTPAGAGRGHADG